MNEAGLLIVRRAYAKQVVATALGVADPRLEAALVAVRREDFLGLGPWMTFRLPDQYVETPDADPVSLIVLLALSCGRDAPTAPATTTPVRSDEAHVPAPAAPALTPSEHASHAPSSPTADRRPCPAIGYFSGVIVDVYPRESWPAGKYRFVIKHDRKTTICNGRIPRPPGEQWIDIVCNRRGVVWADGGFEIHSHPAVVDIVVTRDGIRIAHVHHELEYEARSPHGSECPSFRSETLDLTLPAAP